MNYIPCPYCQSANIKISKSGKSTFKAQCASCGCINPNLFKTRLKAVKEWNESAYNLPGRRFFKGERLAYEFNGLMECWNLIPKLDGDYIYSPIKKAATK